MRELMTEAWTCWKSMIQDGKYMVLLLGALLYLWYRRAKKAPGRSLPEDADALEPGAARLWLWYATLTLVMVVLPPTAALLSLYQTSFYDFAWIFVQLPVTGMIAYGVSRAFMDCQKKYCGKSAWLTVGLAALSLAVFLLCGNLTAQGGDSFRAFMTAQGDGTTDVVNLQKTGQLLDYLEEKGNTETICLWGPTELMAHVRALDGRILLLYGRNMWESDLGAYFYDAYLPEVNAAYRWMETYTACVHGQGEWSCDEETTRSCVEAALAQGVNCILLPRGEAELGENLSEKVLRVLENAGYSVTREQIMEYDLFAIG